MKSGSLQAPGSLRACRGLYSNCTTFAYLFGGQTLRNLRFCLFVCLCVCKFEGKLQFKCLTEVVRRQTDWVLQYSWNIITARWGQLFLRAMCACYRYADGGVELAVHSSVTVTCNALFYLFININQLDALNFIISLFKASTCFEHMCSSSGGQNCVIQSLVSSHI